MRPAQHANLAVAAVPVAPARAALPRARAPAHRTPGPLGARVFDVDRRLDVNRVSMATTNFGSFAFDLHTDDAGLVWPRGTSQTAVFASGLWLGGRVNGQLRVAVAEYSTEYQPGVLGPVPTPENPNSSDLRVVKVARWTGNPADSEHVNRTPAERSVDPRVDPVLHHSWAYYRQVAAPRGAPMRTYRLPVTTTPDPGDFVDVPGPDVQGDQMLWCVYNDADAARHQEPGWRHAAARRRGAADAVRVRPAG